MNIDTKITQLELSKVAKKEFKFDDHTVLGNWNFTKPIISEGKVLTNSQLTTNNNITRSYKNYGKDWFRTTDTDTIVAQSLWSSMYSSGKYQVATVSDGPIYLSDDFGKSWKEYSEYQDFWTSCVINESGEYIFCTSATGNILYSINSGLDWIFNESFVNNNSIWTSSTINNNFFVMTYYDRTTVNINPFICFTTELESISSPIESNLISSIFYDKESQLYLFSVEDVGIYKSSDLTIAILIKSSNKKWYDVSSYGRYILAISQDVSSGTYIISNDGGSSWYSTDVNEIPYSCSVSGNGKYMYISYLSGKLSRSYNYGIGWNDVVEFGQENQAPLVITTDLSGINVNVVTSVGLLYQSLNYGVDWSINNTVYKKSNYITQILQNNTSNIKFNGSIGIMTFGNGIFISNDSGLLWKQVFSVGFINQYTDIAMATDDSVYIVSGNGCVLVSRNKGQLWEYIFNNYTYYTTVTKINDSKFILTTYDGQILLSNDKCYTWNNVANVENFNIVDVSYDDNLTLYILANQVESTIYSFNVNDNDLSVFISLGDDFNNIVFHNDDIFLSDNTKIYKLVDLTPQIIFTLTPYQSGSLIKSFFILSCGRMNIYETYGYVYTSTNYEDFNHSDVVKEWNYIMKKSSLYFAIDNDFHIFNSDSILGEWTQTPLVSINNGLTTIFPSISMSATGQHQTTVNPLLQYIACSHDYGRTWQISINSSNLPYISCSMSGDGKLQLVCSLSNSLLISRDYGLSWDQIDIPSHIWIACEMSKSGKNMAVIGIDNIIYYSTNYGIDWGDFNLNNVHFDLNFNVLGDLKIPIQILMNDSIIRIIYLTGQIIGSDDMTSTWKSISSLPVLQFYGSMSNDGKYINLPILLPRENSLELPHGYNNTLTGIVAQLIDYVSTGIIQSTDSGSSFNICKYTNTADLIMTVALSSSGQYQIIPTNGKVYVSSDYGFNFKSYDIPISGIFMKCLISEDASLIRTVNLTGMTYESRNTEVKIFNDYDLPLRINTSEYILPQGEEDCSTFLAVDTINNIVEITLPKISLMFPTYKRKYLIYDATNNFSVNNCKILVSNGDRILKMSEGFVEMLVLDEFTTVLELISDGANTWIVK